MYPQVHSLSVQMQVSSWMPRWCEGRPCRDQRHMIMLVCGTGLYRAALAPLLLFSMYTSEFFDVIPGYHIGILVSTSGRFGTKKRFPP